MTPERHARIREILTTRQVDLTICLEQVHKPYNVSAIIRTSDAVGIHTIHTVWPHGRLKTLISSATGSNRWVKVHSHTTSEEVVGHLQQQKMQVLATNLLSRTIDFRDSNYTQPTCILSGQEKTGISPRALGLADHHIMIPMHSMVQSLNVSVASAVILYEAQRLRQQARMYSRRESQLTADEQQCCLFKVGYPVLARVAKQKGLPQPFIDSHGQIVADEQWRYTIQQRQLPKGE